MNTTTNEAMAVANTINAQIPRMTHWELGVVTRIVLTDKLGGIELRLGGASVTRGKRVRIVLDASDTYDVEVYKLTSARSKTPFAKKTLGSVDGIYADQLAEVVRSMVFGDMA